MGTSLLDKYGTPPAKQQGVSLLSKVNTQPEEEPDNSENDSFSHKFSSFLRYLSDENDKQLASGVLKTFTNPMEDAKQTISATEGALNNMHKDIANAFDYYRKTPIHQIGSDAAGLFSSATSGGIGGAVKGMAGGMLDMVEKPISTLTHTINENGIAKPASPEEQIQNMQSTLGIVAQLATYKTLSASMLGEMPVGEAALKASRPMQIGNIAVGANTRQALKLIASDASAGALSGAIGGEISTAGSNNHEAIIAGALSFLPLATALGVLGVPKRLKEFNENVEKYKAKSNLSATHDIAATNSLRINSNNTTADLLQRVDAVSSADALVHAAISNKLEVGDGYIVEGVGKELGTQLHEKLNPSLKKSPPWMPLVEAEKLKVQNQQVPKGTYVPPSNLAGPKPKPFGTEVKFESPFDKMAYLVSGKKRSLFAEGLLQNAMEQTGLSETEIVSHGKSVRKAANEAIKSGKLSPRTQAEIDAHEARSIEKGQAMLEKTLPGGTIRDNNDITWIRTSDNTITNGRETLPIDQTNTHKIIGRPKNDNALYNSFANLGQQDFKPNFGRDNFPNFRTYYSPTNGSLLVFPKELITTAKSAFEKYGFLPREIVSLNGVDHRVSYFSGDFIGLEDLNTGKKIEATPDALRRTNHSLQPEFAKGQPVVSQIKSGTAASGRSPDPNVKGSNFPSVPNPNNSLALEWWNGLTDTDKKTEWIRAGFDKTPLAEAHQNPDMVELAFSTKATKPKLTTKIETPYVGTRAAVLTPEVYVNNLYNKFRTKFNESLEGDDPTTYNDFVQRFFLDNNVKGNDISNIHSYFLNRLGDDLANKVLSPEEAAARTRLKNDITEFDNENTKDIGYDIANAAASNNLFFSAEGSGTYRLRHSDGSTYAIVRNLAEAKDAINKIRQQSGIDLDGGSSGSISTGLGNIGGLNQPIPKTPYSKWSEFLDRSKSFGFLNNVTNPYNWFKALDNVTSTEAGKPILDKSGNPVLDTKGQPKITAGTNLTPGFYEVQKALMKKKLMMDSDPTISKLGKEAQSILDMGGKIKPDRRWSIADNLETQTLDQIINSYVGRKANNTEIQVAQRLAASGDVSGIKELLFNAKMENRQTSIGSAAYIKDLLRLGSKLDKKILDGAMEYINAITKGNENTMSGPLVLKLAEAYENPSGSMDKAAHARKNNIAGRESIYRDRIEAWFKSAGEAAGIDPKARINAYLPNIMNKIAGSRNFSGEIPEEFARELTRAGITPSSKLIRDPNQLIIRYFNALLNHKSGATAAINKFSDFVNSEADKFDGTIHEPIKGNFLSAANEYVDEMKGYPSPRDGMSKAGRLIAAKLGFKSPDVNSVLGLMSLGMIAGRPLLAYRDFHNIMGQAFQDFGHEFTNDFVSNATNPEYVADLKRRGILAPNSRQIIDPGMDEGNLLSQGAVGQVIRKWSEKSFSISGQEFAYEHANASIYRTSLNLAEKYFRQLRDSKISKETAYNKLGISQNYGPGWIKQFDDMLLKEEFRAADFYAQSNMRLLSNVYGFHNNPVGWSTNFGRFLGQYGSWSVNATGGFLESISKGNKKQIAAKILRGGMFNKATTYAGSAMGLNLSSWQTANPLSLGSIVNTVPGVGPLASFTGDLADDYMKGRFQPLSESWKAARMFVPYSSMARGWVNGLDAVGQGEFIKGLMVAGGAPAAKP